jgi:hypothetical protein
MQDIIIQIIVPVITAIISFGAATYKSKNDLKRQTEINKTELEKIREQNKADIERMNAEIEKQSKVYENNKMTDVTYDFFKDMMKDPKGATQTLVGITEAMQVLEGFKDLSKK